MPGAGGRSEAEVAGMVEKGPKRDWWGGLAGSGGALEAEKGRQGSTTAWVNPDQLRETYSAVRAMMRCFAA